jgi:PPM family protein phosphatase
VRLATGRATDTGQLRTNNEDAFLIDEQHSLYALADGMGGHQAGDVASRTAIEALRAAFASGTEIEPSIERANEAVWARAGTSPDLTDMGTTLTALTIAGPREIVVGHVGDSRAYLLHNGELSRITADHSLVEDLVREGRLTPEEAESHPQRAIITRAIGLAEHVDVDTYRVPVESGDRILLCSDGLSDMVRDREIESIARNEPDPQRATELLVNAANAAGGHDNITVVIVEVLDVDAPAAADVPPIDTDGEAEAEPAEETAAAPPVRRARLRTFGGALLVLLPVLLIVGIAFGVLGWYARKSYFVGTQNSEVVIFKGVPGGVLGWDPTVEQRTGIKVADLPQLTQEHVQTNSTRGSLDTAESYVTRLQGETTTTSTTTTTTTIKPKTTTTVRRPRTTTTVKKP